MIDLKNFKPTLATKMKDPKQDMKILGNIQVSNGNTTFKNLYVVELDMLHQGIAFYLVQANTLPDYRVWCNYDQVEFSSCKGERISQPMSQEFTLAIANWFDEGLKSHLSPYSYLYGHIKAATGVSLHKMFSFTP